MTAGLVPVTDALREILSGVEPLGAETVPLEEADGRVLAGDIVTTRDQPPFPASAMDGYAVRAEDIADAPVSLRLVGQAAAGHAFDGRVASGETVRIFTGAPLPEGTDTILIQENAEADDGTVRALQSEPPGRYVRRAGTDFDAGRRLLEAGIRLAPRHLALAAAAGHARLSVTRRPRVAFLATGDELVPPGQAARPDQIYASNGYGLAPMLCRFGAEPVDLGIAEDRLDALDDAFDRARRAEADILVTLGGASVGDHDLVRPALLRQGLELAFWKIAMRPGKPLMFGRLGSAMRFLGLPGNPVSTLVCTQIFLRPLIAALLGAPDREAIVLDAVLARDLPANDHREEYMRATLARRSDGTLEADPFESQDSSLLSLLARAEALLIRPANAATARAGDACRVILLDA